MHVVQQAIAEHQHELNTKPTTLGDIFAQCMNTELEQVMHPPANSCQHLHDRTQPSTFAALPVAIEPVPLYQLVCIGFGASIYDTC